MGDVRGPGAILAMALVGGLSCGAVVRAETLGDAIALAYQSNPTLQQQRAQLRALDETYVQARAGWRPTASAQVTGNYSKIACVRPGFGVRLPGPRATFGPGHCRRDPADLHGRPHGRSRGARHGGGRPGWPPAALRVAEANAAAECRSRPMWMWCVTSDLLIHPRARCRRPAGRGRRFKGAIASAGEVTATDVAQVRNPAFAQSRTGAEPGPRASCNSDRAGLRLCGGTEPWPSRSRRRSCLGMPANVDARPSILPPRRPAPPSVQAQITEEAVARAGGGGESG